MGHGAWPPDHMVAFHLGGWIHKLGSCLCLQGVDSYNTTSVTNFVMATNYTGVWCLAELPQCNCMAIAFGWLTACNAMTDTSVLPLDSDDRRHAHLTEHCQIQNECPAAGSVCLMLHPNRLAPRKRRRNISKQLLTNVTMVMGLTSMCLQSILEHVHRHHAINSKCQLKANCCACWMCL